MSELSQGLVVQPVEDVSQELNNRQISQVIAQLQRRITQKTANPTANDDEQDGYEIGTLWINKNTNAIYICANNAVAAAVWTLV